MAQNIRIKERTKNGTKESSLPYISFFIGRSSKADYQIKLDGVSRNHLKVICKDSGLFIEDLNSANGTFLNGNKIDANKEYEVQNNEEIALGINGIFLTFEFTRDLVDVPIDNDDKKIPTTQMIAINKKKITAEESKSVDLSFGANENADERVENALLLRKEIKNPKVDIDGKNKSLITDNDFNKAKDKQLENHYNIDSLEQELRDSITVMRTFTSERENAIEKFRAEIEASKVQTNEKIDNILKDIKKDNELLREEIKNKQGTKAHDNVYDIEKLKNIFEKKFQEVTSIVNQLVLIKNQEDQERKKIEEQRMIDKELLVVKNVLNENVMEIDKKRNVVEFEKRHIEAESKFQQFAREIQEKKDKLERDYSVVKMEYDLKVTKVEVDSRKLDVDIVKKQSEVEELDIQIESKKRQLTSLENEYKDFEKKQHLAGLQYERLNTKFLETDERLKMASEELCNINKTIENAQSEALQKTIEKKQRDVELEDILHRIETLKYDFEIQKKHFDLEKQTLEAELKLLNLKKNEK